MFLISATLLPISLASWAMSASSVGTNSCSGGSRKRTVIGRPSSAIYMASKSPCCIGSSLASAFSRCSTVSEQIISRMAGIRSASKNMCSVRQRPMPSAPNFTACSVSCGLSAFVRTPRRRYLSAQAMTRPNSPPMVASTVGMMPS